MKFLTTADVRAVHDLSLARYVWRYLIVFGSTIALDLVLQELAYDLGSPVRTAAVVAYLCTLPTSGTRFRSLARFAIAVGLATLLAAFAATCLSAVGDFRLETTNSIATAIFTTFVCGCIESIWFFWTCLLTPGRVPENSSDRTTTR
ncbi:hypothetical protein [Rhodopirellula sp. SWK7]|uniref:hypothetical protein n=1 Tax=Rhodopirellula sp. SWK7 TaxID=595460 RepID=UPI0005C75B5E|nr:hypothetical protein [Rhodopirellula sp. SWK7]